MLTSSRLDDKEQRFSLLPELQLAMHEGYFYQEDVPPSLTWVDAVSLLPRPPSFNLNHEYMTDNYVIHRNLVRHLNSSADRALSKMNYRALSRCYASAYTSIFIKRVTSLCHQKTLVNSICRKYYSLSHLLKYADSIYSVMTPPLGSRRLTKNTIADHKVPRNRLQTKRQEQPPEIHFIPPSGNEPPAKPVDYLASIQADLFLFENDNERYVSLELGVDVDVVNYDPFHCKTYYDPATRQ